MRWFVRTSAFTRGELVSTLRQPRLLLTLVLGPFLVLFVFGLGYSGELPVLSTLVVGGEAELTRQVDDYVTTEELPGIAYRGLTDDRETALEELRDGGVDLVVVLPDRAIDAVANDERAVIEVHQRSLDPVTSTQIAVAADTAVSQINDRVVEQVLASAQEQTAGLADQLDRARTQLDRVRGALSDADVSAIQSAAGQLGERLATLADTLDGGVGIASVLGLDGDLAEIESSLRTGAEQLTTLSEIDGVERLDEASAALEDLDEAVTMLRGVEPAVAVRPFEAEVISETPIAVTLDRYFAPGLVALMLQHLATTFAALALVRERQQRTTDLLRVAPASTAQRLVGKSVAFLVLGGLAAAGLTTLVHFGFGVPWPASWLGFVGLVTLTLLASLGYGFGVAAIADSDSQAVQLSMLLLLTAIFFSGLFLPLERIGMPALAVSWLMPATWAFVGMQELMLLARGVPTTVWAALGAIAAVLLTGATVALPRRAARG